MARTAPADELPMGIGRLKWNRKTELTLRRRVTEPMNVVDAN